MGLFEALFRPRARLSASNRTLYETLTAYKPAFTSWRGQMYESELIRAALDAKARHIAKLKIEFSGSAKSSLKSTVRTAPNEWQTWSQFLYRASTILDCNNNCVIVPVFNDFGEVKGFYPVLPKQCDAIDVGGEPWLRYTFANGKTAAIEMSKCGLLTRHQYRSDFFGEDNGALNNTLALLDMQNQGVQEGIKNGATFRFMAKLSNFAKPSDIAREAKQFTSENLRGESGGILLFPNTFSDIKQIESKPYLVDAEQLALIRTNVYNYFGVNEKVLQNSAIGDDLDAFFDGAIEPFAVQLSDVLTRMTFSQREVAQGNKILVTANRLQYMSTTNKIALAKEMGDRGILKVNEIRELFNYEPLEGEAGEKLPARGEYYDFSEGKDESDE